MAARAFLASITPERPAAVIEYRATAPDGEVRWHQWTDRGFFDDSGRITEYQAVGRDITEQKRNEEAIRQSDKQLRLFVLHSPAAVAMFDRDMKYIICSRRWLTDYKLGYQDVVGRNHYDVFPELPERWKEVHRRCLAGAVETHDDDSFLRADGSTDWLRWEVRPWHDARGVIGGVIMFTEVITERKRAEEEHRQLVAQKHVAEALQEVDRRKDEFLAMLAHELRNPLAPIVHGGRDHPHARAGRRLRQLGARRHRAPGGAAHAAGRRPAGRLAHHAGQDQAEPRRRSTSRPVVAQAVEATQPLFIERGITTDVDVPDAAAADPRRRGAADAGPLQPAQQRRQVHRPRAVASRCACGRSAARSS